MRERKERKKIVISTKLNNTAFIFALTSTSEWSDHSFFNEIQNLRPFIRQGKARL